MIREMCAAKSPISLLQELSMMKHMPFPRYDLSQQGGGYMCVVTVDQVSASAFAESKKRAKHLCAEGMLELLQPPDSECSNIALVINHGTKETPVLNSETSQISVMHLQRDQVNSQEVTFNAVGKLNEWCSQKGQKYPVYEEAGIVNQKFIIQCKLLLHTTQGCASTKKHAKQLAAKEMLNSIALPDFCEVPLAENNLEAKRETEDLQEQKKVIELYMQWSSKTKKRAQTQTNSFSCDEFHDYLPEVEGTQSKVELNLESLQPVLTEEGLRSNLQKLGVSYKIFPLQDNPLVLILETHPTSVHKRYTFIHSDETYELTVIGLLKKALRDTTLMFK